MINVSIHDHLPPAPAWQSIFDGCGGSDYFASRAWYEVFVATVARHAGRVAFVAAVDASGEPMAVLPLLVQKPSKPWSMRRAGSLANYYTCLYQPLLCADQARATQGLTALAAYLSGAGADWSYIDLRPLPEDAWYLPVLHQAFGARGYAITQYPAFGNWYLPCAGMNYDTYFNARSKKMRSVVRSKTKQLQEQFSFDMRVVHTPVEVDDALRIYHEVYAKSWKQSEPYPDFIPGFIRSLAEHAQLRLGTLVVDGQAAAAQLWFVAARTAHIFKLAYSPDFAQYSVGTLLTMRLVEHVLEVDRVEVIDFLSGDDDYKKQWMSHRRERIGLEMVKTLSVSGLVVGARRVAGRLRRRLRPAPA